VRSDAGTTVRATATFTKTLGASTSAEFSIGGRYRDSDLPGKTSQLQPQLKFGVNQTLLKDKHWDIKVGANVFADFTQGLDGKSAVSAEYGLGAQASVKFSASKDVSLQVTGGATQSWTFPDGGSATKPFIDARVTGKLPGTGVSLYGGGTAEWTLPGEGRPSSASSLYVGASIAIDKATQIDLRVNHGLDGNGSSYASSSFSRDDGQWGAALTFTKSF
jgi:hypothetical protein